MLIAEPVHYKAEQEIFKSYFPELLERINQFKSQYSNEKFSHILFQFEAHFMLHVCARIFNKKYYRTATVFTLHDCLITTFDHEEELTAIMKEYLPKINGYAPNLESKTF